MRAPLVLAEREPASALRVFDLAGHEAPVADHEAIDADLGLRGVPPHEAATLDRLDDHVVVPVLAVPPAALHCTTSAQSCSSSGGYSSRSSSSRRSSSLRASSCRSGVASRRQ